MLNVVLEHRKVPTLYYKEYVYMLKQDTINLKNKPLEDTA